MAEIAEANDAQWQALDPLLTRSYVIGALARSPYPSELASRGMGSTLVRAWSTRVLDP